MTTRSSIDAAASSVLDAAQRVDEAVRFGDTGAMASELGSLADSLRVVADACAHASTRVVPAPVRGRSISSRYREAVADWPSVPAPSYERLAAMHGALLDVSDAARLTARLCERAGTALDASRRRERLAR